MTPTARASPKAVSGNQKLHHAMGHYLEQLPALQFMRGDKSTDEQELIHTFDQNVNLIHATAKRVYEKKKGGFHRLSADDF